MNYKIYIYCTFVRLYIDLTFFNIYLLKIDFTYVLAYVLILLNTINLALCTMNIVGKILVICKSRSINESV